jgi:hypothetical protein
MPGGVAGAQLLWLPPMPIGLLTNTIIKHRFKHLKQLLIWRFSSYWSHTATTSPHPGIQASSATTPASPPCKKAEPDRIWVLVANNICQNELFAYQKSVPSAQIPA